MSVTPKWVTKLLCDRGAGTGILGGLFPREPWEEGFWWQEAPGKSHWSFVHALFRFLGSRTGIQDSGGICGRIIPSTPGRACASQPQGKQEYPAPVRMQKQEKEGEMGKNWGKVTLSR